MKKEEIKLVDESRGSSRGARRSHKKLERMANASLARVESRSAHAWQCGQQHAAKVAAMILNPCAETITHLGDESDRLTPTYQAALQDFGILTANGAGDASMSVNPGVAAAIATSSSGTLSLGVQDSQLATNSISVWQPQLAANLSGYRALGCALRLATATDFASTKGIFAVAQYMGVPGVSPPTLYDDIMRLPGAVSCTVNEMVANGLYFPATPTVNTSSKSTGTDTVVPGMWNMHAPFAINVTSANTLFNLREAWISGVGRIVVAGEGLEPSATFSVVIESVYQGYALSQFVTTTLPGFYDHEYLQGASMASALRSPEYSLNPIESGTFATEASDASDESLVPISDTSDILELIKVRNYTPMQIALCVLYGGTRPSKRPFPKRHISDVRKAYGSEQSKKVARVFSDVTRKLTDAWATPNTGWDVIDKNAGGMAKAARVLEHALSTAIEYSPEIMEVAKTLLV